MVLSDVDKKHLESLQAKQGIVRDRVKSVIHDYQTGLWIYGRGGTGKSYAIWDELNRHLAPKEKNPKGGKSYALVNSRCTGRSLFDKIYANPHSIFVLEDCETLLRDSRALGVIRSTLWSQSTAKPPARLVTWNAFRTQLEVTFYGGLILVTNTAPTNLKPEVEAIATRIPVMHYSVTNEELAAQMRDIARKGFAYGEDFIQPAKCAEICEHIIAANLDCNRDLDLRLLINAFKDYLQEVNGSSDATWQQLLETSMTRNVHLPKKNPARLADECRIAHTINNNTTLTYAQKVAAWKAQTGKSEAAYNRKLKRLKEAS